MISAKYQSILHQFGKKDPQGHLRWICAVCGRQLEKRYSGRRRLRDRKILDASKTYARRLNAKEVPMPKSAEQFIFPCVDGTMKLAGRDQALRTSTVNQDRQKHNGVLQGEADGPQPSDQQTDDIEARDGIICVVITFNQGSNLTCRTKGRFLNHSNGLMLSCGQIRHWMFLLETHIGD